MTKKAKITGLLQKKILLLDGATGTELQRCGMPSGVCPEAWCIGNPEVIQAIHRAYAEAGSEIVYASTFGANRLKLGEYGIEDVRGVNRDLARLAKAAVGKRALVAGDIGPSGRFIEPFGDLEFERAVDLFKEQVLGLREGGVDLFVIETMMDIQEARAALLAVRESADLFTMVTMTYEKEARTLNGTDPVTALITLQSLGADAVGCNCSTGPEGMIPLIAAMKPLATVPLVAKPNAGMPRLAGRETFFDMSPPDFAAFGKSLAEAGVNLIGGCCGTTPEHIAALKRSLAKTSPLLPRLRSVSAVSSSRHHRVLDPDKPLMIVGERINPTGKIILQQELREGKMTLVRQMAGEQERQGADLLDVNVGAPGIDEVKTIRQVIGLMSAATALPLVIDSPRVETIAAALRHYPGRALINSISGEAEKMRKLLPLAAKYGAMFILLPLTDGEIPETAARRIDIIREVSRKARRHGLTKDDFVVDGLVMTIASHPRAAAETLKTVQWCASKFGCRTILGLSNVSFGMPERRWINATFLAMAQSLGLTMAIANPASEELMNVRRAGDVLTQRDRDAASYIRHFAGAAQTASGTAAAVAVDPNGRVRQAILEGNREDIVSLIDQALAAGTGAADLMDEVMIPAIIEVGKRFDRKSYFLPQLIAGAEAMRAGVGHLGPKLRQNTPRRQRGTVLLATVEGDIHDIGKNIVALMMRNHGYTVIDLGKDIPARTILAAMKKRKPDVVGLSALMTTTMVRMHEVIARARQAGLHGQFLLGGAVVTQAYADSLGAFYAKDGVEAIRVLEKLIGSADESVSPT